jgi:hypothetical protein
MAGKKQNGMARLADPVQRFAALFQGNMRSSGRFVPPEKMHTEYAGATAEDIARHLVGEVGLGVVPIMDDDTCVWAALDLDNHDTDEDLPIQRIEEQIRAKRLPLVPCRSKSGGIHCYLFLEKPQPASRVRTLMGYFAQQLGHSGCEIFPKQGVLVVGRDGKKALGNWINLPYFGADATNRYAVTEAGRIPLDAFLTLAEAKRCSESELRAIAFADHPEAPPCVQKMFAQGVPAGHRNEALYNITVYYKRSNPGETAKLAQEANNTVFAKPLGRAEAGRTISSASRAECVYRCGEEPIRSLCERELCLTRKHGITPTDAERLDTVESLPPFSDLVKYLSQPTRWEIKIDGLSITNLETEQLLDWREIRKIIAERHTRIVPLIKNSEWERMLQPLMKEARIVETPDDASVNGVIRARLRDFASKTDLTSKGQDINDRKALLRGLPVVQEYNGDRVVMFRAEDLVNYLKRTRSEELKGVNLWFAAKELGVGHCKVRIGSGAQVPNINVWFLPVSEVIGASIEPTNFVSDL